MAELMTTGAPKALASAAVARPIVRRADMLGEIMRLHPAVAVAGTHGKTTTTAIVAALFDAAGLFRSAWLMRVSSVADDAQGMIEDLLTSEKGL